MHSSRRRRFFRSIAAVTMLCGPAESVATELFRFDGDYYMVRGPFAAEGEAFMVPPPARH